MGEAPERGAPGSPERPESPEEAAERVRRLRRFSTWAQAGGIVFLAVVSLGLLPTVIGAAFPALGPKAALAAYVLAPAIPIALLVVAAIRLRR